DGLLHVRASLFGLFLGVMDFKARHTEFVLGIVRIVGGELPEPRHSAMSRNRLAVLPKDFHQLVSEPDSNVLTYIHEGNRREVFLHLDVTIGMDFGSAPFT